MKRSVMLAAAILLLVLGNSNIIYSQISSGYGGYLGQYNNNLYDAKSVSSPYILGGSQYSSPSIGNTYGQRGSTRSSKTVTNPYETAAPKSNSQDSQYLGKSSSSPYYQNYTNNPYGNYGSKYSSNSINNPFGQHGSTRSSKTVTNPYETAAPKLNSQDSQYLGKLSSNPYDPDSTSNPYGKYGSRYSPTSINNRYGPYGSPYSSKSANNPYAIQSPTIVYGGR